MNELLAPHQISALNRMKNGSILWGDTGSGKGRVAIQYYLNNSEQGLEDLYVITTAKKRNDLDWEHEAVRFGVGRDREATVAGVISVDSWNNITKYEDVEGQFFIFDEQRLVGNGSWVKSFLRIASRNSWILLSATPGDSWLDYIPVFLAHGLYKNRTEFKREHVIYSPYSKFPKVDRYVGVGKLLKLRNSILVEMPYQKRTTRHVKQIQVEYDHERWSKAWDQRWNEFLNKPIQNVAELFAVTRKIVNSDASRMRVVKTLMEEHNRIIVFYNFDYELEILRTLATNVTVAEWNGHKHESIPDTDKWIYLVQYTAGSEGWECTATDAMIFYSLTYSYKQWHQAFGRIDRLNNVFLDLYYYVLKSRSKNDGMIWLCLSKKKSFNVGHSGIKF